MILVHGEEDESHFFTLDGTVNCTWAQSDLGREIDLYPAVGLIGKFPPPSTKMQQQKQ